MNPDKAQSAIAKITRNARLVAVEAPCQRPLTPMLVCSLVNYRTP